MRSLWSSQTKLKWICITLAFGLLWSTSIQAVIIEGGDGTGNTAAPSDAIGDPGWANVGRGGTSCVYLGNRWVLTCAHVGTANPTFNGVSYSQVTGSCVRLHESADGNSDKPVDLLLYRIIAEPPGLPTLSINSVTPAQGTLVTAIGLGTERGAATADGFAWGDPKFTKRWGRNLISTSSSCLLNVGFGTSRVFQTRFDGNPTSSLDPALAFNEFQASAGDSGGAVFFKQDNTWKLAGIMEAVSASGAANFGDTTFSIDLSYYDDQIAGIMATCPFSGTIVDPVSTLGAGVSAYLSGDGGFRSLAGTCSIAVDTKSHRFTFDTGTNTVSQTGVISGNGGLSKYGDGIMKVSQHNTFSGTTNIHQGTISLDGGDLGYSSSVSIASGARLEVLRGSIVMGSVTGSGTVAVGGGSTSLITPSIHADTLLIGNVGVAAASVPEPGSMILLGMFLFGSSAASCRRILKSWR